MVTLDTSCSVTDKGIFFRMSNRPSRFIVPCAVCVAPKKGDCFVRFTRLSIRFLTLALVGVLTALSMAYALEPWRIVVRVQGDVKSKESGQPDFSPIFRSRRLGDGSEARTGADGLATINLADQSVCRMAPNSWVEMTQFHLTPEGRNVVFFLKYGKIQADVAKFFGKQNTFEVKTPNGVLAARGTDFSVTLADASEIPQLKKQAPRPQASQANIDGALAQAGSVVTLARVYDGKVRTQSLDGKFTVTLQAGDRAIIGVNFIILNPPYFPNGMMMPPAHELRTPVLVQQMQFQANSYQDPGHLDRDIVLQDLLNEQLLGPDIFVVGLQSSSTFVNNHGNAVGGTNPTNSQTQILNQSLNSNAENLNLNKSENTSNNNSNTTPTGKLQIIVH